MSDLESARILLIDDEKEQGFLFATQLRRLGIPLMIDIAHGGAEGVHYLAGCLRGDRPWPWLVFLDIRMPEMGGFAVLRWARENEVLGNTVVVMMTRSNLKADIVRAFQEGAHAYILKSADGEVLRQLIQDASRFARREELLETLSRYRPPGML